MEREKRCTICGETKSISDFNLQRDGRLGRHSQCKLCKRADSRTRYTADKGKRKLLKAYGLSLEDFNRMSEEQGGLCAICRADTPRFHVDHNHTTGVVRGLLCNNCNTGIGLLQEDLLILERAIIYLRKHGVMVSHQPGELACPSG